MNVVLIIFVLALIFGLSEGALMASSQVEFASSSSPFGCVLRDHNRRSTPSNSYPSNIKGYLHSCINSQNPSNNNADDSSWLPTSENHNNLDDTWLPTYNDANNSTATSESENSVHRKGQNDFDDSWLPTYNENNRNGWTTASESDNSVHHKTENDFDCSWLPSTYFVCNENKHKEDDDNNKSKKSSRNHDRWALAREVVFSCDQQIHNTDQLNKKSDSTRSQRECSPSQSESSVEIPNLGGVSSLLRRWRDLAEAKNNNKTVNYSPISSRSNSGSVFTDINNPPGSPSRGVNTENNSNHNPSGSPPRGSDAMESRSTIEESFADWESDKRSPTRPPSCPLPSRSMNAIDAQKEKPRVADLIRKLSREEELAAGNVTGNEPLARIRTSLDHQHNGGEHIVFSPRLIRGRQAFNNFLFQMEQDKRRELEELADRKHVSKFSHRGRIQALLRVRFLRIGVESRAESKSHRRTISKTLESNRLNIMHLRDRFSSGVEQEAAGSKIQNRELCKNTPNAETSAIINTNIQEPEQMISSNQSAKEANHHHHDTSDLKIPACKVVIDKPQDVDTASKSNENKEDPHPEDVKTPTQDLNTEEFQEKSSQLVAAEKSSSGMEEKGTDESFQLVSDLGDQSRRGLESLNDWISEYSQTRSEWDEQETYDMQFFDTSNDWITDIARPRSDWEGMRQARYQEMLDPFSDNGDIRQLLERRSVSSFLSSSMREKIDQLMVSRTQGQSYPVTEIHIQKEEVKVREDEGHESRKEEAMEVEEKEEEEEQQQREEEEEDEEDDDGSMAVEDEEGGSRYSEYGEFIDQMTCSSQAQSPPLERTWRPNGNHYDSDQMASPSLGQSPYFQNNTPQSSSFLNHHSIEIELIYDLRGHMEQLHQEIMELRKSIKSCVSMQVKMQRSMKHNVAADPALTHSGKKKGSKAGGVVPGKRNCSICCEMQVDSVFYRCGHMCTCFKCAMELQCSSAKCPVCGAPIVDVVRAFPHI